MQPDAAFYESLIANTVSVMLRACTDDPTAARLIAASVAPSILIEIEATPRERMVYFVEPLLDEAQKRLGQENPDSQLSVETAFEIIAVLQSAGYPDLS